MDDFSLFAVEAGPDQLHLTARINRKSDSGSDAAARMCAAAAEALNSRGMRILNERAFGTLDFHETYTRIRQCLPGSTQRTFSYIQGTPVHGGGLSGIQVHAVRPVSGTGPKIIHTGQQPCGSIWEKDNAAYIYLTGIHGHPESLQNEKVSRRFQASSMFDAIQNVLVSQSVDFGNIVRTWIYLCDILDWYDTFNTVRTEKFRSFGLIPAMAEKPDMDPVYLPASTGVGGRNPEGTSCCGDILAVSGDVGISMLQGTRQPSAYSYGSAFSRGTCIDEKECRQIFISGTAAIDTNGHSLHAQDVAAQIRTTLEIIEELIGEKGANLKDIGSATVYLKRASDWNEYEKLAEQLGIINLPVVFVVADICRDELLFEMDAIVVVNRTE